MRCNIADGFYRLLSQRNVVFCALAQALNTADTPDCPQLLKPFTLELSEHVTFSQEKVLQIKAMQSLDAPRLMAHEWCRVSLKRMTPSLGLTLMELVGVCCV